MTGLIFNIQRLSVNNGPGIRTTVFQKGVRFVAYGITIVLDRGAGELKVHRLAVSIGG